MTSEGLFKLINEFDSEFCETKGDVETVKIKLIGEIAYQLAKLNEHFEMVDGAVFGGVNVTKKEKKVQKT